MVRYEASNRYGRKVAAVVALAVILAGAALAREGNYLIVTAPDYAGSTPLNQLVAARTAAGFTVAVYAVPAGTSRTAIKTYILSLWGTANAPDYLLIVGDTDGDPSGAATIPHWVGGGTKSAPTDWPYACMDGGDDWVPEFPVGRFSVRNVSQLQAVVDKTLTVENGAFSDPDYVSRAAFLATDDGSAQAEATHDFCITNYLDPADFQSIRIYAAQGGSTTDVTNAVNSGVLLMVYFGHSNSSGWWSPAFNQTNVNALNNAGLYGLVFGFSCNTANYPTAECCGETWLRAENKGAAAYISASTYIYYGGDQWDSSRHVEKQFFKAIFEGQQWEVGLAWLTGMKAFIDEPDFSTEIKRNLAEMFVLLGDPALLLPRGSSFALHSTPAAQDICTPPATQAAYTITAEQFAGFAEPITLTATGLPPGASVSFSVNNVPPPFTSDMVISGLSAGSAGSYTIEVTGTATSKTRVTTAGLNINNGSPALPALLTPANGAVDVLRTPTLTWNPVPQALTYDLEIALDAGFTAIAYTTNTAAPTVTLPIFLDPVTTYYWHVRALNGCGVGNFAAPFTFTTSPQRSFFTELFITGTKPFDLAGHTVAFIPDGSASFYAMCVLPITALPSSPAGGTVLTLGDDASVQVTPSQPVSLFGVPYSTFYVGSNGYLTFGSGDTAYNESFQAHFTLPRIAALFDDLNPSSIGTVSWKQYADRVVTTWQNVPEYNTTDSNTFQIELFFDGEIHLSWLGVAATDGLVGLSAGGGIPGDFVEMGLSTGPACQWADFSLAADPPAESVCAPANAIYQIEVSPDLGFSEIVTLSALGAPAGATVQFSSGAGIPPFTSTLTIGNLAAATPGDYAIQVIGTATSLQHYVDVSLRVATGLPPVVTLSTPANGATGVTWTPALAWQAAAQATTYELEVATDAAFAHVVYSRSLTDVTHTLQDTLAPAALYYWRVRGVNSCGNGTFSTVFHFTTLERLDYFTQLFSAAAGNFDLQNFAVYFVPDGTGDYYRTCAFGITSLPTDPAGGTALTLTDDSSVQVTPSQPVTLYGVSYNSFYVGSNGYLTFTAGDNTYNESLAAHFDQPRVSGLFDDLNPASGGTVSWMQTADGVTVTWLNIHEWNMQTTNTFQIELLNNGRIHLAWLSVAALDGLVGLSRGQGVPGDYQPTDFSAVGRCVGDGNCDGTVRFDDIDYFVESIPDNEAAWRALYAARHGGATPVCPFLNNDVNGDGHVNFADIDPFVALFSW